MSELSDFRNRRTLSHHTDEEIEFILTGGAAYDDDLADIASFLANFRDEAVTAPTQAEVDRFARRAASIARSTVVPTRTAPRPDRNRLSLTALRARSATAVATAALAVFSALGLTANAAVPGDFLYGLDLAMEIVGIGNGSLNERVGEARVLSDRDDHAGAIELLSSSISENPDASPVDLSTAVDVLSQLNAVHGNSENNNPGGSNNAGGNSDDNANQNSNAGGNSENNNPDGSNNAGGNSENNNPDGSNNAGGNSDDNTNQNSNAGSNSDDNTNQNSNAGGNSENNNSGGNSENNTNQNSNAGSNSENNTNQNSNAGGNSTNSKGKSGS